MKTTTTTTTATETTARSFGGSFRRFGRRAIGATVLAASLAAGTAGVAGAETNATNLNFGACGRISPVAELRHSAADHAYWGHGKLSCNVNYRFTVKVKDSTTNKVIGAANPVVVKAKGVGDASTPAFTAVAGHAYQVLVEVADTAGQSLGYMTSGAPQTLVPLVTSYDKVVSSSKAIMARNVPYVWGGGHGATPGPTGGGVDCSGFVRWAYKQATGRDVLGAGNNLSQAAKGTRTTRPIPGDLVVWSGHIGIYVGRDTMIDAAHSGTNVRQESISAFGPGYWFVHVAL